MAWVQYPSGEPHSLPALAALAWGEQGSPSSFPAAESPGTCWLRGQCLLDGLELLWELPHVESQYLCLCGMCSLP